MSCAASSQLVEQLGRQPGEIVDEIERVLDLMRDPGGQLTERGQLLRLDQAVLRSPKSSSDSANFCVRASTFS